MHASSSEEEEEGKKEAKEVMDNDDVQRWKRMMKEEGKVKVKLRPKAQKLM